MSQNDQILDEDTLYPFPVMSKHFKVIKENNGSFQAIHFITNQMKKIDGVQSLELEKGRLYSTVYFNPATKTAFLYSLANKNEKSK